jgi:acetyl esterase/lipase
MMRGLRILVWIAVVALTALAWPPARSRLFGQLDLTGITLEQKRVFQVSDRGALTLDVYLPSLPPPDIPPRPRPAVLAIHGGSWIGGSKADYQFAPRDSAIRLARAGLVVVTVEYSLARPGSPSYPAVVGELRQAVRWIRAHAAELNVDPGRIIAFGQSSGAHLAALLAAVDPNDTDAHEGQSSRVQAVIGFSGAYDLRALLEERHLANDPIRALLSGGEDPSPALLAEASPLGLVNPQFPPMLLVHGTADGWIPVEQSLRMASALERAKVLHKLILLPEARHGFEATVNSPTPRDLLPEIFAFLEVVWNTPLQPR